MANAPQNTAQSPACDDASEMFHDKRVLADKHKVMDHMKWNALLGSIAESCKFVAGPLFGVGIGAAMAAGVITPLAIGLLGAAVAFLVVGVASGFTATRIWQSGQFDNFELNAQSTARHLVQELKSEKMCMTYEQNCRADGKKWVQVTSRDQGGLQTQV
jgi:hypothetical protein